MKINGIAGLVIFARDNKTIKIKQKLGLINGLFIKCYFLIFMGVAIKYAKNY